MVILMFLVTYGRFYLTKVLNRPSNPLLEKPSITYKTLRGTIMEHKADPDKHASVGDDDAIDLVACFKKVKDDVKFGAGMQRSTRIRQFANFLPEDSVK